MAIAGRVAIVPKDAYDSTVAYQKLDLVRYNHNVYIAKKASTGVLPTDEEYWMLAIENVTQEQYEAIVNGTTKVDKAKTADNASQLGGKSASEYALQSAVDEFGAYKKVATSVSDIDLLNNELTNGIYYVYNATNMPSGNGYGFYEVVIASENYKEVNWRDNGTTVTYKNCRIGGVWQGWKNTADGGNADTVNGKHASEFALLNDLKSLGLLVNDLATVSVGSTHTFSQLLALRTVTFFTNAYDTTNFPSNGSGILIPYLDQRTRVLFYIYDDRNNSEVVRTDVAMINSPNQTWVDGDMSIYWFKNATTADLANYLNLDTGGTVNGNVIVTATEAVARQISLANSLRRIYQNINANGDYQLYDGTNQKSIIASYVDATSKFFGIATENLPLYGGKLTDASSVILRLDKTGDSALNVLDFLLNGTRLGCLGFWEKDRPIFYTSDNQVRNLIHNGNVGDYAVKKNDIVEQKVSSPVYIPFSIDNTHEGSSGVALGFYLNGVAQGGLSFDNGVANVTEGGVTHRLHHDGNSAKVAIQSSAPSDTTVLWVDTTNKKVKAYIDGAWTAMA